jgi:hypothetical protein
MNRPYNVDATPEERPRWWSRRRKLIATAALCGVGFAFLATIINVVAANRIQRASMETLFLASELQSESGPAFGKSLKMHAHIVAEFEKQMESRFPTVLFRWIKPGSSPRVQFKPALDALTGTYSNDADTRAAIKHAGSILEDVGKRWAEVQPTASIVPKPNASARNFVMDQLADFRIAANQFLAEPSVERAESTCMASRLVGEQIIKLWPEFTGNQRSPVVAQFVEELGAIRRKMETLAPTLGEDEERVRKYADHVQYREKVFAALNESGPAAVVTVQQLARARLDSLAKN